MKAKAGDVYCVYHRGLKRYTACQITRAEGKDALLLVLDWTGEQPLRPEELPGLKPLALDFMFWNRDFHLVHVDARVPGNYLYAGNIPPLVEEDSRSYGGWSGGYEVWRQQRWEAIPAEKRRAFKEAAASRREVDLGGQAVKERTSRLYDTAAPFARAAELKRLPCLTDLTCTRWYPDLPGYLRGNPFLTCLRLEGHGQKALDLRGTAVARLTVDLAGVEELWLPEEAGELLLLGNAPDRCHIHAAGAGAGLAVSFHRQVTRHPELAALGTLHCTGVEEADIGTLAEWYPALRGLRLWGRPGVLRGLRQLGRLRELGSFSTVDLFGFGAEDIPLPEELPALTWLWMSSLPEEAAKEVRRLYKKREGLNLRVEKPRKPDWLAENLDNPFRHWDGMEGVPPAAAKRAAGLYKKLRAGLLRLAEERPEDAAARGAELVRAFTRPFNRMPFVETEEREDIYEALCRALEPLPAGMPERQALLEVFEAERDF